MKGSEKSCSLKKLKAPLALTQGSPADFLIVSGLGKVNAAYGKYALREVIFFSATYVWLHFVF